MIKGLILFSWDSRSFCPPSDRPSALDSLTPDEVSNGQAEQIQPNQNTVMAQAHVCYPERFGSRICSYSSFVARDRTKRNSPEARSLMASPLNGTKPAWS